MMNCVICGRSGSQSRSKAGWICADCVKACGGYGNWRSIREWSVDEMKAMIDENRLTQSSTREGEESVEVGHPLWGTTTKAEVSKQRTTGTLMGGRPHFDKYIIINERAGTVRFPQITLRNHRNRSTAKQEYPFDQILGWELLENGTSITKGGLGAAAVGGALFGGVGAITGGIIGKKKTTGVCRELRVKVTIRSTVEPVVYIDFVQSQMKTTSNGYRNALEAAHGVMSLLAIVCEKPTPGVGSEFISDTRSELASSADEIRKYKGLLDDGIITEEEFAAKKKQLMGI